MLKYFIDRFIGQENLKVKENRDKIISITGVMGLCINLLLFTMKIIIGLASGSIAIVSDSINNLSDSMTSIVTIYGSRIASKPADKEHPYGHGRSEYIASMILGLFICVVGFQLFTNSIKAILNPSELTSNIWTLIILLISIGLKFYMYIYNKEAFRLSESPLNKTIAKDSINDVIATSLVLASIVIYRLSSINIDGVVGLILSIIILKSGVEVFLEIGNILLGKEINPKTIERMKEIILEGQYITGVHQIEIHEYGRRKLYGSCHAEVPANIDVYSMHKIVNEVEKRVYEEMDIRLTIHVDPNYLLEQDKYLDNLDEELLKDIDH